MGFCLGCLAIHGDTILNELFKRELCDMRFCELPNPQIVQTPEWSNIGNDPTHSRYSRKRSFEKSIKIVVILSVLVALVGAYNYVPEFKNNVDNTINIFQKEIEKLWDQNQSPEPTIPQPTESSYPTPSQQNKPNDQILDRVVEEINVERHKNGIKNVTLTSNISSKYRADDMLNNSYFGHYDLNGYMPNYYYTQFGGKNSIEENVGYLYTSYFKESDITYYATNSVHNMIFDDAGSDWGHRDSLLDPTNNFVDVSISHDEEHMFLVIHMLKIWVNWITPPTYDNGIFSCSGILTLENSSVEGVSIYYSNPLQHQNYSYNSILKIKEGEHSYDMGDQVAGVVPEPYFFTEIQTIRPIEWSARADGSFKFSFRLEHNNVSGLYTIVVWAENTLPYNHPYDPSRYRETLPILEYSIILP